MDILKLSPENINNEHICCAISDKKCQEGYQLKKDWLKLAMENGYVFRRLDARAKVFIEYGPAENAWQPVEASNYLMVNCFWVSGKYKQQGYGKQLLNQAIDDAHAQGKNGLVTVVGHKKYHFMSDGKWLLQQGFEKMQSTSAGFELLALKLKNDAPDPCFTESVINSVIDCPEDIVVYYSNRCPFTDFHVNQSLVEATQKRGLTLKIHHLKTMEQAQQAPTPATIFSLFHKKQFVTTDISACMDSRFDKFIPA